MRSSRTKRFFRNSLLLLLPFFVMVVVNEFRRASLQESYRFKNLTLLNAYDGNENYCTWHCHNDTGYCKKNHTAILQAYFGYTDPLYFGAIRQLKNTGNYKVANILLFVVLLPLWMFYLLVKIIDMQVEMKTINQNLID